jgi:hypothetical protein
MALYFIGLTSLIGMTLVTVDTIRQWSTTSSPLIRSMSFVFALISIPVIIAVIWVIINDIFSNKVTVIPSGLELFDE